MRKKTTQLSLFSRLFTASYLIVFSFSKIFAAQPLDLYDHPLDYLKESAQEITRVTDIQGTTHIRMQQLVDGHPIWGGDYIIHLPKKGKNKVPIINGQIYKNVKEDLATVSPSVFNEETKNKAIIHLIENEIDNDTIKIPPTSRLFVYVDEQNLAHWIYHIHFVTTKGMPNFLIDAVNHKIYQRWDELKTFETVSAGGFGGNPRVGMYSYDGLDGNFSALSIERDPQLAICYLRNSKAVLRDYRNDLDDIKFSCEAGDRAHNGLYWDGLLDYSGGGYSPSNDTLYAASKTSEMFENWYSLPAWKDKMGKAKRLVFLMHSSKSNASFNNNGLIIVGDSLDGNWYYPFCTLDIIAHEMGHGITYQNSGLVYYDQPGGVNEAFSDMTGKTAEYYANGAVKNWNIGEILTDGRTWLRYMDHPNQDCEPGRIPGFQCSIENVGQIPKNGRMDVHYASGLFNRFFYLMANSPSWDIRKTYHLMLHANRFYWTTTSSFCQAARGVWLAAKQLNFDEETVIDAFKEIGIDPIYCRN